jgi:soluble cytochrome b562
MDYFSTISKVMDYTDDDLKDKDKYNEYTKALFELVETIDSMPFVKSLITNIFDTDFIAGIDDLLAHADDVYSKARQDEVKLAKQAPENNGNTVSGETVKEAKKFTVEELIDDYLKQSEIQKSFKKPSHYFQAYNLLRDFAKFVIGK